MIVGQLAEMEQEGREKVVGNTSVTGCGSKTLEGMFTSCPIRTVLDRLGDRWTVLVLVELEKGPKRFSALHRAIPDVSPRMLSQTVRRLEQDGMISRKVFATVPPQVEYSMTSLGGSFVSALQVLVQWAADNGDAVMEARKRYVAPAAEPAK